MYKHLHIINKKNVCFNSRDSRYDKKLTTMVKSIHTMIFGRKLKT